MVNLSYEPNAVAGYLYRHLGESMPEPVLDDEGRIDVEADNALIESWAMDSDCVTPSDFDAVPRFLEDLQALIIRLPDTEPDNYMFEFFEAAKTTFDGDKSRIRTWFAWLYLILLETESGPRWGDFVQVYGLNNFIEKVRVRLFDISYQPRT